MSYTNGLDKPSDYFSTKLYTGTGSSQSITGVGFQPDMNWIKTRTRSGYNHCIADSVRGSTTIIRPNLTNAEHTYSDSLTSFDSDGFSLGSDSNGEQNKSGDEYVSWNWLGGGSSSSNTSGSITSTVSANTTSGFSIVSWTGNGSNGATIGHGLGTTPAIIITKRRNGTGDWLVGGSTVDTVRGGANSLLLLNGTNAMDSNSEVYQTFSSTTFQVGVNAYINTNSATMISYCFAEKKGFSKFGSYVGNGSSDGSYIHLGFSPSFVIRKRTDSADSWQMHDNKRDTFNVTYHRLLADDSGSEYTSTSNQLDFLSSGFKCKASNGGANGSGGSYIYMAFAENPFVTSSGIPTCAR